MTLPTIWVLPIENDAPLPNRTKFTGVERRLPNPGVAVFYEGLWLNNNTVVFVGEAQDRRLQSYVQSVEGSPARPIARPEVRVALASPDGAELAAYGKKEVYYRLSITEKNALLSRVLSKMTSCYGGD